MDPNSLAKTRMASWFGGQRAIYAAPTLAAGEAALERSTEKWDGKFPAISPAWRAESARLTVFFDYLSANRKVIYTTNAIESLNY